MKRKVEEMKEQMNDMEKKVDDALKSKNKKVTRDTPSSSSLTARLWLQCPHV